MPTTHPLVALHGMSLLLPVETRASCWRRPAWSLVFSTTTRWNGAFDVTAIAFDRSGNGSQPSAGTFDAENAYVTKTFTTHLCDPATTGCPKYAYDNSFSRTYPAIANMTLEWSNSSFSSNDAGDGAGRVGYTSQSSKTTTQAMTLKVEEQLWK